MAAQTPGAVAESSVQPALFGPAEAKLFGCLHPVRAPRAKGAALICPPIGYESIRAHRCLRNLAGRLAADGVAALRFDYFGCGDSAGDMEDATLETFLASIHMAVPFLRQQTGADEITVIGLRLGATLAALAGSAGNLAIDRLVLWEPVVRGAEFAEEMRGAHERHVARVTREFGAPPPAAQERLGYRFLPEFLGELNGIDLLQLDRNPAEEMLVIDNAEGARLESLRQRLARLGATAAMEHVPEAGVWDVEPHVAALPHASIRRIVEWLAPKETP